MNRLRPHIKWKSMVIDPASFGSMATRRINDDAGAICKPCWTGKRDHREHLPFNRGAVSICERRDCACEVCHPQCSGAGPTGYRCKKNAGHKGRCAGVRRRRTIAKSANEKEGKRGR